jgi:hypothetical protein
MKKLLLLTSVLGLLWSAGTAAQSWWQQPPRDDATYLYALGEGYTVSQAQDDALKNIGGKLGTTVAAQMQRYTQDTGDMTTDDISQRVSSQVNNIELGFYEVMQTHSNDTTTRVLLRLNKPRLAQHWQGQVLRQQQQILPLVKQQQLTTISDYRRASQLLPLAQATDRLNVQLAGLTNERVPPSLEQALRSTLDNSELSIAIKGELTPVNDALSQLFLKQGITTCTRGCNNEVRITSSINRQKMFGKYVSILTLNVAVYDSGQLLNTAKWTNQVASVLGAREADQAVLNVAIRDINARGVWTTLGYKNTQ